jgi:glutathione S-transferase
METVMKLLGGDGSPYVRKVRVAIAEKGIAYDHVAVRASSPEAGITAFNPLGKIPTLVLDDGTGIYDSSVIVEYVDGLSPSPKLIPDAFADRIAVKRWEALGDGIMDAAVAIVHDRRLTPEKRIGDDLEAKQMKKITAALAFIENELAAHDFCHGNSLTLADVACGTALGYLDRVVPEFVWRNTYSKLNTYAARLAARPAFVSTSALTA